MLFEPCSPIFRLSHILCCAYGVAYQVAQSKNEPAISNLLLLLMLWEVHHVEKMGLSVLFSILVGPLLVTDSRILGGRSGWAGHVLAFWAVPVLIPETMWCQVLKSCVNTVLSGSSLV